MNFSRDNLELLQQFCTGRLITALSKLYDAPSVPLSVVDRRGILDLWGEGDTHVAFQAIHNVSDTCQCEYCNPDSVVIDPHERCVTLHGKSGELVSLLSSAHADPEFWIEKAKELGDGTLETEENRRGRNNCVRQQRQTARPKAPQFIDQFGKPLEPVIEWKDVTLTFTIPTEAAQYWIRTNDPEPEPGQPRPEEPRPIQPPQENDPRTDNRVQREPTDRPRGAFSRPQAVYRAPRWQTRRYPQQRG